MTFDQKLEEWRQRLAIMSRCTIVEMTPKEAKELGDLVDVALNEMANLNKALCQAVRAWPYESTEPAGFGDADAT